MMISGERFLAIYRITGSEKESWAKAQDLCLEETVVLFGNISLKPIFPCPGGGMSLDRVPAMLQSYGTEVIFLIGGGLFKAGPDIVQNCRYFRELAEKYAKPQR